MNFFKLLILLLVCSWSQQNELHAEFDEALSRSSKRESPKFSKNVVINRKLKSSMKRSSEIAKISKRKISKRSHRVGFSPVGFTINSTYCPFKQSISSPSSTYRSYDGSCNNVNNPLNGIINMPFKRVLPPAHDEKTNSSIYWK